MDELFSSNIDDIPISMTKYTNLIEKIKFVKKNAP